MAIVLFDTNILIDNLAGHSAAANELAAYDDAVISSISYIEVACKMTQTEKLAFKTFLTDTGIQIVHPNDPIMDRTAELRGASIATPPKFPVPDCIIRATAEIQNRIVVTRNPADFGGVSKMVRVPYDIVDGKVVNIKPVPL
jgi:predicted nucleic acid-binding protein